MISAAAEAGADCVKLQKSCLKDKFNGAALARPYTGIRTFPYLKITIYSDIFDRAKLVGEDVWPTQGTPRARGTGIQVIATARSGVFLLLFFIDTVLKFWVSWIS